MKTAFTVFLTSFSIFTYAQDKLPADTAKSIQSFRTLWSRPIVIKANGGLDPLYVVDGNVVATEEGENIDRTSIESICILRDTASARHYGNKGGSPIILIETKNKVNSTIEN
ncbi:MAG: hypothetical protein ABIS36_22920 [Chryseolinea sp.]